VLGECGGLLGGRYGGIRDDRGCGAFQREEGFRARLVCGLRRSHGVVGGNSHYDASFAPHCDAFLGGTRSNEDYARFGNGVLGGDVGFHSNEESVQSDAGCAQNDPTSDVVDQNSHAVVGQNSLAVVGPRDHALRGNGYNHVVVGLTTFRRGFLRYRLVPTKNYLGDDVAPPSDDALAHGVPHDSDCLHDAVVDPTTLDTSYPAYAKADTPIFPPRDSTTAPAAGVPGPRSVLLDGGLDDAVPIGGPVATRVGCGVRDVVPIGFHFDGLTNARHDLLDSTNVGFRVRQTRNIYQHFLEDIPSYFDRG
ncbi:hypothetical protein HDU76_009413, partial [Blyttiomyces sp. JEL0837]